MHLLYLDESGHPNYPATEFFVLAGFSVFERSMHWLDSAITPIAARFNPACPSDIEFHGAPMRGGKEYWRDIAAADRVQAVVDVLALLGDQQMKLGVYAQTAENFRCRLCTRTDHRSELPARASLGIDGL